MHICSHGESSSKKIKKKIKESTGTGLGTEDDSIGMIHNNNKQHDVMAALAGWERRNKKETTFLLAPANLFHTKLHLHQHQSLIIFHTRERSQPFR